MAAQSHRPQRGGPGEEEGGAVMRELDTPYSHTEIPSAYSIDFEV